MNVFGKRHGSAILGKFVIDRPTNQVGYIDGHWSGGLYRISFVDGRRVQRRREQFRLIPTSLVSEATRLAFD